MSGLRSRAYIIVFGALWGAAEMMLGGTLHAMHVPMRGMIMAAVGAFLVCSAVMWIGGRGTALTIGVIAAFLKLFSIGGLVLSPAVAILAESVLAEAGFILFGRRLLGAAAAGMMMVGYTLFHKFGSMMIVYRMEIREILKSFTSEGGVFYGTGSEFWWLVLTVYLIFHLMVGCAAGSAAYFTVDRAQRRI